MGCGGSRTNAIEPRYLESWTKQTESTWLTSTNTDIPLSSIENIPSENSESEKNAMNSVTDFFDDGLPAPTHAYLNMCSVISDPVLKEIKPTSGSTESQNSQQVVLQSLGTTAENRSVLRIEETLMASQQNVNQAGDNHSHTVSGR